MGGLDAVAGLFAVVGGALSAGQVQIVVQQANIPITMLLSRLYLKVSSYAWSQYVGASIIVLGGLLSAFGAGGAAGGGPLGDGGGVSAHVVWFGPVLILIGIIPGSMSNVYKEENFKTHNLDIYFLTTYVAVWQTALSFLCVPLFTLSYFGGIPYETKSCTSQAALIFRHARCAPPRAAPSPVPSLIRDCMPLYFVFVLSSLDEMPQNLVDGWHCFMGRSLSGYLCDDPSPSTGVLLLLYVVVNFAFNMALLSMVKHGSALALVVAVAVALPITNLMFTQRWAMGTDVEALSLYNLLGIVLVVVGFLLYSLLPNGGTMPVATVADMERGGVAGAAERAAAGGAAGPAGEVVPVNMFEQLCREFVVPTGPSGHSMHITEYLPSVLDGFVSIVGQQPPARERRHSFDFHSSPSVRDVQQARKKRLEKVIGNKTPSRTP
jgi:hypothetical protein